jgi:glycosyltransferase involved in cell wall biosynthesis
MIVAQDMTSPLDRRVWLEANTLKDFGCNVVIVCPNSRMFPKLKETIDGISIFRYPQLIEGKSIVTTALEYLIASFFLFFYHIWIVFKCKVNVIQYCNPPDFLFMFGFLAKRALGVSLIFDQHDLSPELLLTKGFSKKSILYKLLDKLETLCMKNVDAVVFASHSFLIKSVQKKALRTTNYNVIKTGPKRDFGKSYERLEFKNEEIDFSVGYVGRMGSQDNLSVLLEAISIIVFEFNFTKIELKLVGDGPECLKLRNLAKKLRIERHVQFLGYISEETRISRVLKECTIAVCPDFPNEMNSKASMNKITEYMALELPIVQFNLEENVRTSGGFSKVVKENSSYALASAIMELLNDSELRSHLAKGAKDRFLKLLCWESQEKKLLEVYARVLGIK